jgi:hypothetical protein
MNPPRETCPASGRYPRARQRTLHALAQTAEKEPTPDRIQVLGGATAEELAALLTALSARARASRAAQPSPDGYELWRQRRLAARRPGRR